MVVSRRFEPPDLVVATLRGVVSAHDQIDLLQAVRASIGRAGHVRLLILLDTFGGWNIAESINSPESWLDDDEGVAQIAIVGRREWKLSVLMLVTQPLRQRPIKYFENEDAARRWLGAGSASSVHGGPI